MVKSSFQSKEMFPTFEIVLYSQFHKTLPKSSLQMDWISVRFFEMGDSKPT